MTVADLSLGSYGPEVKWLQQRLRGLGYKVASSEVARSLFGPSTRAALEQWQRERGFKATGALAPGFAALMGGTQGNGRGVQSASNSRVPGATGVRTSRNGSGSAVAVPALLPAGQRASKKQYSSSSGTPPTVTLQITVPSPDAYLLGSNPVPVLIQGTMDVTPTAPGPYDWEVWVNVSIGNSPPQVATVSGNLDIQTGGPLTWQCQTTLPGGITSIKVKAQGILYWKALISTGVDVGGTIYTDATPITVQFNSQVTIDVESPQDGQIFAGSQQSGVTIQVTVNANSQAGLDLLEFSVDGTLWPADTAPVVVPMTFWAVPLSLGPHTLLFTAHDIVGHSQTAQITVQVALPQDIFAVDPTSYLRALVEFATWPFNGVGWARISTYPDQSGIINLTPDLIDQTFCRSVSVIVDPVNNARATETVSAARISIEVLRRYLAQQTWSAQPQKLADEEAAYRAAAYRLLLNQAGTSYEELRMARMYDRSAAQDIQKLGALADRLGIHLRSTRPDELDILFFDIGAPAGAARALSENVLEVLFGLQDTTRDPFSQGPVIYESQPLVTRWMLRGMRWNRTTDANGFAFLVVFLVLGLPHAVVFKAATFNNPRAVLAVGPVVSGVANLEPVNNSGVSGQIVFNTPSTPPHLPYVAALGVFPLLQTWQRQRLRTDWAVDDGLLHPGPVLADLMHQIIHWTLSGVTLSKNTDGNGMIYVTVTQTPGPAYQVDLYSDAARTARIATASSPSPKATIMLTEVNGSGVSGSVTLDYKADSGTIMLAILPNGAPAVDPDLLTDGDFVSPDSPAYQLYTTRTGIVSGWLSALKTTRETAPNQLTGLDTILASVLFDPQYYPHGMKSADVITLDSDRQRGEDVSRVLTALSLDLAAFNYLVPVCNFLNAPPPPPPVPTLLDSEWQDVYSILAQVQKRRAMFSWIAEEQSSSFGITVSPDYFTYPPSLPKLFGTGVGEDGQPLADGAVDPHWSIIATPAGPVTAKAYATTNATSGWPIGQAWLRNSASSRWISPQADESVGDAPGLFTYRTNIDLDGYDPASVRLIVKVAVDNAVVGARLNGSSLPLSAGGFTSFTALEIAGPFQPGVNIFDLIVRNDGTGPNPSGLRVEVSFGEPPVISSLPAWRATVAARSAWELRLQGRMDEDAALERASKNGLDETEKQMLPKLRDGLLGAASTYVAATISSTGANTIQCSGSMCDSDWQVNGQSAFVTIPNTAWLPNDQSSQWIAPSPDETGGGDPIGTYIFHTTLNLLGVDMTNVWVVLDILVDAYVTDVLLNGKSLGWGTTGYTAFTQSNQLVLTTGFVAGTNTLDIVVSNGHGAGTAPCGLRVFAYAGANTFVDPEWLSASLLLDVQATDEQGTTRLNDATQMMQSLFSAIRNNQFAHLSPPSTISWWLTEALSTFDQEWATMGTYESWNALMLMFLYPENVLSPALRLPVDGEPTAKWQQTKEFVTFVSDLRAAAPLTPKNAVKIANAYAANLGAAAYPDLPQELVGSEYADPRDIDLASLVAWAKPVMDGYVAAGQWAQVAFLWEAWFSVAVQIGLELQKAQQFEAAVAWYGSVYAYSLPLTQGSAGWIDNNRKYFPGLLYETNDNQYLQVLTWTTDSATPHQIAVTRAYPYARFMNLTIIGCLLDFADARFTAYTEESISEARLLYQQSLDLLSDLDAIWPADPVVPRNPQLAALRARAETNLTKIRAGRNIAGLVALVPQSSESLQPSAYHYSALVDRAKQIAALAQQAEGAYLSAMEKAATEAYSALQAQQDLESATAAVKLESLKVTEANDQVSLAQGQANKAQIEVSEYTDLTSFDLVSLEEAGAGLQALQAGASASGGGAGAVALAAGTSIVTSTASLEEKQIERQAQLQMAYSDANIARNQIALAQEGVAVASQDLANATLRADHAAAVVNFLANKFTNAELYQWMSGVLGSIYSYFLRQATSIARLAESQLAFERQEKALAIIQSDYWRPIESGATQTTDTQGLTGADQLLADITQLDQYALDTDQIKLQLTKTISLARLDPVTFQQFTQTGLLRFRTPMTLFDRDFPGHYLRLIKHVRVSVVALIPPNDGIRATLTNNGISRVVAVDGSGNFTSVVVRRDPQVIALSSPTNATGIFDLTAQPTMLLPFEDLGVDTSWEFIMPRAANLFDFTTIADVLLSIDYTALDSQEYRGRVIRQLNQTISADRAYSFRQEFADAWYYLNNPNQSSTPMVVQFETEAQDFPANIEDLTIQQLVMYFVPASGSALPVQPTATLTFAGTDSSGNPESPKGTEIAIENIISTRRSDNPTGWSQMIGMQVSGSWTLDLSDPNTSRLFQNCQLQDILFVMTYKGRLTAWPT
jgi:peptidoglycan hydrolase-like protein with peptidoglycan-binding domain